MNVSLVSSLPVRYRIGPACLAAFLLAAPTLGDQLVHLGALKTAAQYDTNPLMRSDGQGGGDIWIGLVQPMYRAYWMPDARSQWQLDVELRFERSSDRQIIDDREDPTVELFWTYEGQRNAFDATASSSAIPARLVEFEETGIAGTNGTRRQDSVRGNWEHAWDPRTDVRSLVDIARTRYEGIDLVDYTTVQLRSEAERNLTERHSVRATARLLTLDPTPQRAANSSPGALPDSRLVSAAGGTRYSLSPLWRIDGEFGLVLSERLDREVDLNWTLRAAYDRERLRLTAQLRRSTEPSGVAELLTGDALQAELSYDHSPRTSLHGRGSYRRNRSPNRNESLRLGLEHRYRLTPQWTVKSLWEYRDLEGFVNAEGMVTTVTLEFSPG